MVTNKNEKVVVLGASNNPERYAYKAANMLVEYGFDVIPVGVKSGEVAGKEILNGTPALENIHTLTLYLGPQNQLPMMQYILSLKPKRVIFNPGTENEDFENILERNGIEPVEACTLVMLRTGQF